MKIFDISNPLAKISAFALGVATVSALSVTLPSSKAEALSLVSNIVIANTETANQVYQLSGSDGTGASFLAPNYATTLTNIQLAIKASSSAGSGVISMMLYSSVDSNKFPSGSPVMTFNSPIISLTASQGTVVTFTPSSTISLIPNAAYAFVAYTQSGSSFQVQSSCVDTGCSGSPGYTNGINPPLAIFFTPNNGTNWFGQSSQRVFAINVEEVPWDFSPEQGAVLGLPLFIGLRMLKKKRASSKFEASLEKQIN